MLPITPWPLSALVRSAQDSVSYGTTALSPSPLHPAGSSASQRPSPLPEPRPMCHSFFSRTLSLEKPLLEAAASTQRVPAAPPSPPPSPPARCTCSSRPPGGAVPEGSCAAPRLGRLCPGLGGAAAHARAPLEAVRSEGGGHERVRGCGTAPGLLGCGGGPAGRRREPGEDRHVPG